ncbi:YDG domain-containing protein, partial [Limnohabitans planktonicus]
KAKELTFAAVSDTKIYDGGTSSSNAASVTGTQTGDTITAVQSFASKNVLGANNSTLQVGAVTINDGNNGNNYTIGNKASATGTIKAKELTFAAVSDTKIYDGGTSSSNAASVTGTQTGDTITAVQSFASKNVLGANNSTLQVGAVTINDGNNGNNYTIGNKASATGTIKAKELTFAAVSDTKIYDGGTSSSLAANVVGKQGDDTITAVQSFASKNVLGANGSTLQVGAVTINDGNNGNNYTIGNKSSATGTITPKELTLAAVTDSKVYDGSTSSSLAANVVGTQTGDTITAVQSFASKNVLGANNSTLQVGAVTINDGNNGNNYTIGNKASATGTIKAKELTFAAVSDTKIYDGGTSSSNAASVTGKQGDDTITAVQSFASKNVLGANNSTLQVGAV